MKERKWCLKYIHIYIYIYIFIELIYFCAVVQKVVETLLAINNARLLWIDNWDSQKTVFLCFCHKSFKWKISEGQTTHFRVPRSAKNNCPTIISLPIFQSGLAIVLPLLFSHVAIVIVFWSSRAAKNTKNTKNSSSWLSWRKQSKTKQKQLRTKKKEEAT